ncbi:MAG: hypothetical protein BGO95_00555 [Micrococcales bacterium 73-13]|nr:MAG: hypothetical protein BGO95_00555 [Micrococcales bacterium 73-13]
MADAEDPGSTAGGRPRRPLWWWFIIHGAIIAAWGAFALISPIADAPGWIFDGVGYAITILIGGVQLAIQGWSGRRLGPGWLGLVLAGLVGMLFGVACFVAAGFGDADGLFWVVIVFLLVDGAVVVAGTVRDPVYRFWGILMGGIIEFAAVVLLVVYFVFPGDFNVIDPVFGSIGLLYGIAVIVGALQVRDTALRQGVAGP